MQAQDTPISKAAWLVTKRCVGDLPYPSIPQEKWTFDGVIFSDNGLGVRAIRTDVATSYYVALDGDDSFALNGSFSPDGKRFAYPTGTTSYNNLISNYIGVDALQVVGTSPRQEKISIPWNNSSFSGVFRGLNPPRWLDDNHFMSEGTFYSENETIETGIIDAVTGEISVWKQSTPLSQLSGFSPDQQRALLFGSHEDPLKLYDFAHDQVITELPAGIQFLKWLPDSSSFIALVNETDTESNPNSSLTIFNKDGVVQDVAITGENSSYSQASLSHGGDKLAFFLNGAMYIAELSTRKIVDLCFEVKNDQHSVAWSPDDTSLVVSYDGFPVIINYQTLEMQVLRYKAYHIWGWYPIN